MQRAAERLGGLAGGAAGAAAAQLALQVQALLVGNQRVHGVAAVAGQAVPGCGSKGGGLEGSGTATRAKYAQASIRARWRTANSCRLRCRQRAVHKATREAGCTHGRCAVALPR